MDAGLITVWEQGGAVLLIAAGGVIMLRYILQEQKQVLTSIIDSIKGVQKQQAIHSSILTLQMSMFMQHDLTVRGINPTTGVDMNERAQIAYKVYQELQNQLSQIKSTLEKDDD